MTSIRAARISSSRIAAAPTGIHCVVVSAVYPPEPVTSARTSADVAHALAELGHRVTVLAPFPSRPAGRLYPGHSRGLYEVRGEGKVTVIRCRALPSRRSTLVSRLAENLSFGVTSALRLAFTKKPHVIYSNTWPIFASAFVALVARARNIPTIVAVQDLYPESLVAQGRIDGDSRLARLIRRVDGWVLQRAEAIIVIARHFAETLARSRNIDPDRIAVIPNWSRDEQQPADEAVAAIREQVQVADGGRIAAFGGNIGAAAGVDQLIAAAGLLKRDDVRILVAGDGTELPALRRKAEKDAPGRVVFRSPWPIEETGAVLALADVLVLPTAPGQTAASVPSKLITYMLAGRPVIVAAHEDSEVAAVVRESRAGWRVDPGRPDLLAELLDRVLGMTQPALAAFGANGRRYALQHFTREACLPTIVGKIDDATRRVKLVR